MNNELNKYQKYPVLLRDFPGTDSMCAEALTVEVKIYHLHRYLSCRDFDNKPFDPQYPPPQFLEEAFILAECWKDEPNIDLMLIEICHGGTDRFRIAEFICRHSPLLRAARETHNNELFVFAKKCREEFAAEQQRIKDEIFEIENGGGCSRCGGRGRRGGESDADGDIFVPSL